MEGYTKAPSGRGSHWIEDDRGVFWESVSVCICVTILPAPQRKIHLVVYILIYISIYFYTLVPVLAEHATIPGVVQL